MNEVKMLKNKAENLNNRIQDAIVVKKTRQRAGETKRSAKKLEVSQEAGDSQDKEQEFRSLLEEAKELKLQSEQISKLTTKINDIDNWKHEVQQIFNNVEEETLNYKRYLGYYKSLLARSTVF
jgi:vacuolar-type H+-ATPase subunit I/STV1